MRLGRMLFAKVAERRVSLRLMFLAYGVVPLVLALALTGYIALTIWERQVEARMQSDLELVARAIQLPLSDAMERDRRDGVEQALEAAFSVEGVYSAYAYDLEGEQIASVGRVDPDPQRGKLTELAAEGQQTGEYGQVGSRRVYSRFVPLTDSRGHASGLLQLTRRERDFRDYSRRVRFHGFTWLGLAVFAMTGLVLVGHNHALGRHFQHLTRGMQRIAGGDAAYRVEPSGPREIVAIADNVNRMLDSIQAAQDEIRRNRRIHVELEDRLRQQEKLAAIGQLAAGVAHELGAPLSVISGTAQRSLRTLPPDSGMAAGLVRIRREVERMEVIIRQLLDFSHGGRLKCRRLRPGQMARSSISAVAADAVERDVRLELDGDDDAPSLYADPIRLEQALVNLLRNAIQAGRKTTVRLHWRVIDHQMMFRVDDSGPGIPDAIRSRLYEPFFTTKRVGVGTGLGLAVVHGIVREHGGSISDGRSPMGGARFELTLPLTTPRGEGHDE